jgi:hypothetical protein
MFTSCGWFFDDIGGLESRICLRYAAHAIDSAGPDAPALHDGFRTRLATARSNDPAIGTGADIYDRCRPRLPAEIRAAAAAAVTRALDSDATGSEVGPYHVEPLPDGIFTVQHRRTGRTHQFKVTPDLHRVLDVSVEVRPHPDGDPLAVSFADLPETQQDAIRAAFRRVLRPLVLSAEETGRVADGVVEYRRAIANALVRRLPQDPAGTNGLDLEGITRALELLALEDRPVPFEAQTRYARLLAQGPPELRKALRSLGERFGFAIVGDPDPAPSPSPSP